MQGQVSPALASRYPALKVQSMAFTLKQLRYFIAVAEAGGLTAASQVLRISQPSLSAAIAQLEAEFGVQLFLRHRARGLSLTRSGQRFLADARRLLDHAGEVAAGAQDLAGSMRGPLEIGCFTTLAPVFLPPLLADFGRSHPDITVGFREASLDRVQDDLLSGACELALLYDLNLSERLEPIGLAELAPYVLLAADHPLAARRRVSLSDLAAVPMVLLDLPHSRDYFRSFFLASGQEPNVRHRTANVETLRGLVAFHRDYGGFTAKILPAGKARVTRWCQPPQATRNAAGGQKIAAFGGANRPSGGVALLARCPASRCAARLPRGTIGSHETAIISVERH